jgi:RNA methyltransferase, TrmH family
MPRRRAEAAGDARVHARALVRICGLAAVQAVLARDPGRIERLFFAAEHEAALAAGCRALAGARKPYRRVAEPELARVAGTVLHGGVVAVARPQAIPALDPREAAGWAAQRQTLLILDGIGNPHNLGAIVRSAAFFGIDRLVLAERPEQALPSDASYRIAEGGFEHLGLYRARLPEILPRLKPAYRIVGTALTAAAVPPWPPLDRPAALVLGNEECGLAPATLALCDRLVRIPGSGRVQSLNVAAAAAVLLYAATRKPG